VGGEEGEEEEEEEVVDMGVEEETGWLYILERVR